MRDISKEVRRRTSANPFAYIAFWQALVFVMMIALVWVCELFDLSAIYFETPHQPPNIFRGAILSAAILVCAFVMIGNTYAQQKRVVHGLLTVCSHCRKIQIDLDVWQHMESYFCERSLAAFSHGFCPDCLAKLESAADAPKDAPGSPSVS